MSDKSLILSLAEVGVSNKEIALRARVSESYVSQIVNEETYRKRIIEAKLGVLDERTKRDAKYDELEDKLIDKMNKAVNTMCKPRDIMNALIAINKAERRGASSADLAEIARTGDTSIVVLDIPERAHIRVKTSSSGEVVAINNRNLITMDSRKILEEIKQGKVQDVIPKQLSAPSDGECEDSFSEAGSEYFTQSELNGKQA